MITSLLEEYTGEMAGEAAGCGGTPGAAASPSLSLSNNCNENERDTLHKLTGGHKRCSQVVHDEIEALANCFSLERLGFFTLTFAEEPDCAKAALKKFHSLLTGVLKMRYGRGIRVLERGEKNNRLHFHCVVVLPEDIRTGFNFDDLNRYARKDRRRYASANPYLRSEWAYWRRTAPRYGFGQVELLPIRSNSEGIARYVGSYIGKHVRSRVVGDKGVRLVGFWGYKENVQGVKPLDGENAPRNYGRVANCRHNRLTEGSSIWRFKVKKWAEGEGFKSTDAIKCAHGPKWCQKFHEEIMMQRIEDIGLNRVSEKAVEIDRLIKDQITKAWEEHKKDQQFLQEWKWEKDKERYLRPVLEEARQICSKIADEQIGHIKLKEQNGNVEQNKYESNFDGVRSDSDQSKRENGSEGKKGIEWPLAFPWRKYRESRLGGE